MRILSLLTVTALLTACARQDDTRFSLDRARDHVRMLAGTIGSRPVGTEPNDRAREYIVGRLRALGFDVRVQTADARRPELGLSARVHNIIALREGRAREAIALVSHYDSSPHAPGGADDALGVAVSLEAARVLVARDGLEHALAVIVTDGEEAGLLGAAALDRDPVAARLGAYINLEAVGSGGPPMLFEAGPGNAWVVDAWAEGAPSPRGGSFAVEVYRRIPNDTDFSILKRLGIPGLNFAAIVDGYAYHTARDSAERLAPETIEQMGQTVVGTVRALDGRDLTQRSLDQATYGDLLGVWAFSVGPKATAWLTGLALLAGILAWTRALRSSVEAVGIARLLLTAIWSIAGAAAALVFMIAAAVLLRASREVLHPWYAHPDRLFALTALMGALGGWTVARAGALLPPRIRGTRHPTLVWAIALPVWIFAAALAAYFAPTAAYLFLLPLLVCSILLVLVPLSGGAAVRAASTLAFLFNLALWGWITLQLLRFAVAHFGRQPIVTPPWVYAALMFAAGLVIVPPLLAAITGGRLRRPALATALLMASAVVAVWTAWMAPAYTQERPQRRYVRFVHDASVRRSFWQVAGTEPGLDLEAPANAWRVAAGPLPLSIPLAPLPHPFVWTREVDGSQATLPARVTLASRAGANGEFSVSVVPSERGLAATFLMPEGLAPVRPNLPGVIRRGRWLARFVAIPDEGIALRGFVDERDLPRLADLRVIVTRWRLHEGPGWQGLPPWLPRERTVWAAEAAFIIQPLAEVVAPPPPGGNR